MDYKRLIELLEQKVEMGGLGGDEADELLLLLEKTTQEISDWIGSYPQ